MGFIAIAIYVRTQNPMDEWRRLAPPLVHWVLNYLDDSDRSYIFLFVASLKANRCNNPETIYR